MSARTFVEVALRVMGIWYFVTAIHTLTATVIYFASTPAQAGFSWGTYVATGVPGPILGALLTYFAPAIAAWFYPASAADNEPSWAIGPGDLYHTASFVLGAYFLVSAARPAIQLLIGVQSGSFTQSSAGDTVLCAVYSLAGFMLIFGSRRIAVTMSNLRYDPNTIPKQQFSLGLLLLFILLFAVVLGVLRIMTPGP